MRHKATITKEEAKELLSPYVHRIVNCVESSVNTYFTNPALAPFRLKLGKRSDASNCHDFIKDSITDEFEGVPGVRAYTTRNQLFLLSIQGRVVLRFKLFDENKFSRSIMTQQLLLFNNQEMEQLEIEFANYPHGLLHVGYTVNDLRTGVENLYITYRYRNRNLWDWDLYEEQMAPAATPVAFPTAPAASTTTRRKVMPKHTDVGDLNANS